MRLRDRTLGEIALMICGDAPAPGVGPGAHFPYRSSSKLTQFFSHCDLNYAHQGQTRRYWVQEVLKELNLGPSSLPDLPSSAIVRVLKELMDPLNFDQPKT